MKQIKLRQANISNHQRHQTLQDSRELDDHPRRDLKSNSLGAIVTEDFDVQQPCETVKNGTFSFQLHSKQHKNILHKLQKLVRDQAIQKCSGAASFNPISTVSSAQRLYEQVSSVGSRPYQPKVATDHFLPRSREIHRRDEKSCTISKAFLIESTQQKQLRKGAEQRKFMGLERQFRAKSKEYVTKVLSQSQNSLQASISPETSTEYIYSKQPSKIAAVMNRPHKHQNARCNFQVDPAQTLKAHQRSLLRVSQPTTALLSSIPVPKPTRAQLVSSDDRSSEEDEMNMQNNSRSPAINSQQKSKNLQVGSKFERVVLNRQVCVADFYHKESSAELLTRTFYSSNSKSTQGVADPRVRTNGFMSQNSNLHQAGSLVSVIDVTRHPNQTSLGEETKERTLSHKTHNQQQASGKNFSLTQSTTQTGNPTLKSPTRSRFGPFTSPSVWSAHTAAHPQPPMHPHRQPTHPHRQASARRSSPSALPRPAAHGTVPDTQATNTHGAVLEVLAGCVLTRTHEYRGLRTRHTCDWGDVADVLAAAVRFFAGHQVHQLRLSVAAVERCAGKMSAITAREFWAMRVSAGQSRLYGLGQTPQEHEIKAAAVFIQKFVRGCLARRLVASLLQIQQKLVKFVRRMKTRAIYVKNKKRIASIIQEYSQIYEQRADSMLRASILHHAGNQKHLEIHLNSLGSDTEVSGLYSDYPRAQSSSLLSVISLLDPNVQEIIIVTFDGCDDGLLTYYTRMLEIAGVTDAKQRIRVVKLSKPYCYERCKLSLSLLLYLDDTACNIINSVVGARPCYLVGGVPNPDDIKLAVRLNMVYSSCNPVQNSKQASQNYIRENLSSQGVATIRATKIFSSGPNIVDELSKLSFTHIRPPIFKFTLGKNPIGAGTAYLNLQESTEIKLALRSIKHLNIDYKRKSLKVDLSRADLDVSQYSEMLSLKTCILKSLNFCFTATNPQYARKAKTFFERLQQTEGIVEIVDSVPPTTISGLIDLLPDGRIKREANFEKIMNYRGLEIGLIFPAQGGANFAGQLSMCNREISGILARDGWYGPICIDYLIEPFRPEGPFLAQAVWSSQVQLNSLMSWILTFSKNNICSTICIRRVHISSTIPFATILLTLKLAGIYFEAPQSRGVILLPEGPSQINLVAIAGSPNQAIKMVIKTLKQLALISPCEDPSQEESSLQPSYSPETLIAWLAPLQIRLAPKPAREDTTSSSADP